MISNKVDVEDVRFKKDILGFVRSETKIEECLKYLNCSGRHKLVLGNLIAYARASLNGGVYTEEDITHIIDHFADFVVDNKIINEYISGKLEDQLKVKTEISNFFKEADKKVLEKQKEGFESVGATNAKVYAFVNGNKQTGIDSSNNTIDFEELKRQKERLNRKAGFIGAFVISALAATIEITTVLYIVLKGM